ncbi:MAG: hypothetical protein ACLS29_09995, partial [Prevotellamassilia sp.]
VRYKTTQYLLGSMDTHGAYKPNFLDYQAFLSWHPNRRWSFDLLGNISDNHYNFKPEDRETKFGTITDAKSFKVYFDGKEKDAFRTLFGAATLTRHFNPETFLALQFSSFATKEQETYDIQGEYWLNEAMTQNNWCGYLHGACTQPIACARHEHGTAFPYQTDGSHPASRL